MSTMPRPHSNTTTITSYPKWNGPSQAPSPVAPPREIPPLLPPSSTTCPNPLPSRPDPSPPPAGWDRSRHIIPAAYPRSFVQSTGTLERSSSPFSTTKPRAGESKDERIRRNLQEAKACIQGKFKATPHTGAYEGEKQLWLAGECWRKSATASVSRKEKEGLTLVVSAANGFTKEVSPRSHIHLNISHLVTASHRCGC